MNSDRVSIQVGDRVMFVSPHTAARVRKQIEINRARDERIARELKYSRIGPGTPGNQFAGWSGAGYRKPVPTIDNRAAYHSDKAAAREKRWQELLV